MTDHNSAGGNSTASPNSVDGIPLALRLLTCWMTWAVGPRPGDGLPTKRPHGSTSDPCNRKPWSAVRDVTRSTEGGVGINLAGGLKTADGTGNYLFADLDSCVTCDVVADWAQEFIDRHQGSYAELSPSGKGLRVVYVVNELPAPIPVIYPPVDSPDPHKRCQIQIFGCGPSQFVTMTGRKLPNSAAEIRRVPDSVKWLTERYAVELAPLQHLADHRIEPTGDPVELDDIERVAGSQSDKVAALVRGDWAGAGYPSASEGYVVLARAAMTAAHGHPADATRYLIERTAYGRGQVDSKDPAKYMLVDWVRRDVERLAAKQSARSAVAFETVTAEWVPPSTKPAPPAAKGLIVSVDELASRCNDVQFLLAGLIPADGTTQIYGDPSAGKSTLAVSIAAHVAAGCEDWYGVPIGRTGGVVYIIGEGYSGVSARFQAAADHLGTAGIRSGWPLGLTTDNASMCTEGEADRWVSEVNAWREAAAVADPTTIEPPTIQDTEEAAETAPDTTPPPRAPPPVLIVIDTMASNFGPGHESDTEDMGRFHGALKRLGLRFGAAVVFVHHSGHGDQLRARGNSANPAAVDASMRVEKPGLRDPEMSIYPDKLKDGELAPPFRGTLTGHPIGGEDAYGAPITAALYQGDPRPFTPIDSAEPELVEVLQMLAAEPELSARQIASRTGNSRRDTAETLKELESYGWITLKGHKRGTRYVLTEQGVKFGTADSVPNRAKPCQTSTDHPLTH